MAARRHIGFGHSAIRAMMVDKHFGCYNFDLLVFISDITPVSTDIFSLITIDIVDVTHYSLQWPLELDMTTNDKNNTRNEFYTPKSVTLEVLYLQIV